MYFEKIPTIPYPFGGAYTSVKDITLNIRFKKDIIENITLYDEYDIEDGDTPEIIAERLYNDPGLYWILMLFNEKYHYYQDFPMSEDHLISYVEKKYGEGNAYKPHFIYGSDHYETEQGHIVDKDFPGAQLVTNFDYEFKLNETKRRIKIINPRLVSQIAKEADELLTDG